MSISKALSTATGVPITYHRVIRVMCTNRGSQPEWVATVFSWLNADAHVAGERNIDQSIYTLAVAPNASSTSLFYDIEQQLVSDSGSRLFNGTLEQEAVDNPLNTAKDRKWREVKALRDEKEFSVFTWDGSPFDTDAASQSRIQGAFQLAILAVSQSAPFSIDWTLADNSVRTMSATDMVTMGAALGSYISGLHYTARELRLAIEAAETVEDVDAVQWPSPVAASSDMQLGGMGSSSDGGAA